LTTIKLVKIITFVSPESIKSAIEKSLETSHVEVQGDGTHFEAVVVSGDFEGKTPIDRHKLVYSALGDAMKKDIHALSIKTYTPEQWSGNKQGGYKCRKKSGIRSPIR